MLFRASLAIWSSVCLLLFSVSGVLLCSVVLLVVAGSDILHISAALLICDRLRRSMRKGVTWVPKVGGRKFEAEICDVIHGVIYIKFFLISTLQKVY